jgi:heme exporter protein A
MGDPDIAQLSASNLACDRGERRVFSGVDFTLLSGAALAIVGPNGSGKSSFLRLIAGLLKPAEGVIAWNGRDVADDPDAFHSVVHYVGHHDAVKPALTPAENLTFFGRLRGSPAHPDTAMFALDAFGLGGLYDLPSRFLSQGQRRRLALARLLMVDAPLWLLDEPTLGLDIASLDLLAKAIALHREGGGMVIAATHGGLDLGAHNVFDFTPRANPT